MDAFRIAYLIFGSFICVSGTTMIVTYSRSYRWWHEPVGRMMVIYAGSEVLMSGMLTITVVAQTGPHWFRAVWFALQILVGCCFTYQTVTINRLRHDRVSMTKESEDA
jgi:hypothetical protein